MRILIACEFSGVVREAFRAKGHDAISCDLLPCSISGPHFQGDILTMLQAGWDMMLAFPPCTHLAVSGARWFKDKQAEQAQAIGFFLSLASAPIERIAIENPIGIMSTRYRKPDQIVQPWQFGHGETKATCLWLKGLPLLKPSNIVSGRNPRVHYESPGMKNGLSRAQRRSLTLPGIAQAMADQWDRQKSRFRLFSPHSVQNMPLNRLALAFVSLTPYPMIVLNKKAHEPFGSGLVW